MSGSAPRKAEVRLRTPQFREVWIAIESEVEKMKEDAIAWGHSHERFMHMVGQVAGLRRAQEIIAKVEKDLMGDDS